MGRALFPPAEAAAIAGVVERDLPYYQPAITPEAVAGINRFAASAGLLDGPVAYDKIVATQFASLWAD